MREIAKDLAAEEAPEEEDKDFINAST